MCAQASFGLVSVGKTTELARMQKTLSLPILLGLMLLPGMTASAQCLHDELEREVIEQNPQYLQNEAAFIDALDFDNHASSEATVYTIPVVVHVIYNNAADSISKEQVEDGIAVLNEDYRRLNADASNTRTIFQSVAADTEIEFRLAKLDPNGNCTTGITYTESALSVDAGNNVKGLISWPNSDYMNIWVVNSIASTGSGGGTVLGYAYKPSPGQSTTFDGIVIRHDRLGRIGTSNSLGRTLTHEAGHYLGLDHPFKGGCFQGDNCADTPPVSEASFGCDLNANSCSNDSPDRPDQIENYMDYADDACTNLFTQDQKTIMRGSLQNATRRGYLITAANQTQTGIVPGQALPCVAEANFKASQEVLCKGQTVSFFDISEMGNATSWQWSFPAGTPSTSTAQNPQVTYNSKGNFDVSLTVTNAVGTTSKTHTGFISVRSSDNPMWVNDFSSGFEFSDIPNGTWHVDNPDNDNTKWKRISTTAYQGNYCIKLDNYNNTAGNIDAVISEQIVVDRAASLTLAFQYAAASRPGNATDKWFIEVSDDCGLTWDQVRTIQGPLVYSQINKTNAWQPSSSSHWRSSTTSLNAYAGGDPIMVKIGFISGGGNNAYLDNIELAVTLDQEEHTAQEVLLFPNPSNDGSFEVSGLEVGSPYTVVSTEGRMLQSGLLDETMKVQLHGASAGYYFFQSGGTILPLVVQ